MARERRWEGEVLVLVRVGSDGRVSEARLQRSSGYEVLDRAALEGVSSWLFEPARKGGEAMDGEVVVPIRFELKSL